MRACQDLSNTLTVPIPLCNVTADLLKNTLVLMTGVFVIVIGLPFVFVCHISLFSKLVDKQIQGEKW